MSFWDQWTGSKGESGKVNFFIMLVAFGVMVAILFASSGAWGNERSWEVAPNFDPITSRIKSIDASSPFGPVLSSSGAETGDKGLLAFTCFVGHKWQILPPIEVVKAKDWIGSSWWISWYDPYAGMLPPESKAQTLRVRWTGVNAFEVGEIELWSSRMPTDSGVIAGIRSPSPEEMKKRVSKYTVLLVELPGNDYLKIDLKGSALAVGEAIATCNGGDFMIDPDLK